MTESVSSKGLPNSWRARWRRLRNHQRLGERLTIERNKSGLARASLEVSAEFEQRPKPVTAMPAAARTRSNRSTPATARSAHAATSPPNRPPSNAST
jgi:hypothetical protein